MGVTMSELSVRTVNTVFHADLSDAHPGEDYWISVAGQRIPLAPHTPASLAAAHAAAPHLMKVACTDSTVTHYTATPMALPAVSVIRMHLRHSQKTFNNPKCDTGIGLSALYIPPSDSHLAAMDDAAVFHAPRIDWVSTAQNFLFHHPDLITNRKDLADRIINTYMVDDETIFAAITQLALRMRAMGPATETGGWATLVPFTPPASQPVPGKPGFDGERPYYKQQVSQQVQSAALAALTPLLIKVQNDPAFNDKKWSVQSGASVVTSGPAPSPAVAAAGLRAEAWNAAVANTSSIHGLTTSVKVLDPSKRQVSISMSNSFIRYLGCYIRFYDAGGNAINVPDWKPDDAGTLHHLVADIAGLRYNDVRYLGHLAPTNFFLGIPTGPDGSLTVQATFPPNAVSASVYGSGLGIGSNPWPKTPALGGTLTGVCNFGVPAFMLGLGVAAKTHKPLIDIIDDLMKSEEFITAVILGGTGFSTYIAGSSISHQQMNWSAFTTMADLIFSPAATNVLAWVMAEVTATEVAEQIPFAGWVMLAINIAAGIAQMAQTMVAVATSDWNIENKIATTITTAVTVHPDPRAKVFPQGLSSETRSLIVKMIYQDQARPTVQQTIAIPAGSTATSFAAGFANNTLGGQVKFEADFFVGDWLAGKATTGLVPNDASHAAAVTMYLIDFPRPLSEKSIYIHSRILTYNNQAYGWTDTAKAPVATIADQNTSPTGNGFGDWTGLALSQRTGLLGSSWKAAGMGIADCVTGSTGQLYAFMSFNIPGTAMTGVKFPGCGFTGQSRLIYDPYSPKFKQLADGNWDIDPQTNLPIPDPGDTTLGNYYVDPRSAGLPYDQGGGYHLRMVTLDDTTPFNMASGQKSFGRFAYFPDSVCLHPSGLIIGVSALCQKLQIVTLNRQGGLADAEVPLGQIGAGPALDPTRPGLMFLPVAVACAYDGTIIGLEDTKSSTGNTATIVARLSAYDLQMKPVSRFFHDGNPSPWLYLADAADNHYLDMAIVGDDKMTYIYVLYHTGNPASPSNYRMAIYTYGLTPPKTNPLVTTNGIAARRLAVDMWHSAYTLNFAMVTDADGKPAGPKNANTGPAGRTVPSVSMWLPSTPSV
jgi:hypothetical protein